MRNRMLIRFMLVAAVVMGIVGGVSKTNIGLYTYMTDHGDNRLSKGAVVRATYIQGILCAKPACISS